MSDHSRRNSSWRDDHRRQQRSDVEYSLESPYATSFQSAFDDFERPPSHRYREYGHQSYTKRTDRRPEGYGYGYGGIYRSLPSDRGLHNDRALQEPNTYRRHHGRKSPVLDADRSYVHESRNPKDAPTIRNSSNNIYTGGCPYSYAHTPVTEQNLDKPDIPDPRHKSTAPGKNETCNDEPQRHGGTMQVSGPCKPVASFISPVKAASFQPVPKPMASPLLLKPPDANRVPSGPRDANVGSHNLSLPFRSDSTNAATLTSSEQLQSDRRSSRTLSCEKSFRPEENRFSGQGLFRTVTAPLEYSAIAHPATTPSGKAPEMVGSNEQAQQNGSLSKWNNERSERRDTAEQPETLHNQLPTLPKNNLSVQEIFNKVTRMPKCPEHDLSGGSTPTVAEKSDGNGMSFKEVQRPGTEHRKMTRPALRSVPAPPRGSTSEDIPQRRAAGAAMHTVHTREYTELKPQVDCRNANGGRSPTKCATSRDSYDTRARRTTAPSEQDGPAKHRLASSMAKMNIVDQEESISACESERAKEAENQTNNPRDFRGGIRQVHLSYGDGRDRSVSKRRGSDFEESGETRAKRPRQLSRAEPVNVDGTTVLRRSRRFQHLETNKTWETIKFEAERVHKLFLDQLKKQPMLLQISFLGLSDGDLRTTLDLWESNKGLLEPDQRRLEVNNNRIRRITDEMCMRISALRVVSLNLSCNLLTTVGAKIGLSSKLKCLNVSRNRLSSLPQELCDLTNLEILNMSHNDISRIPSGFCKLIRLEVLSLAWNKLEVLPEDVAAEGAVLSDLDLAHNESFHFFPRCAEHWTKLEVLHMPGTTIYKSLSRREHRLRPAALVRELAGRKQDMFNERGTGLRLKS